MGDSFHSDSAPQPVGHYPHARKAGPFLYLSGIGPRKRGSAEIPGVQLDEAGNIVDYDISIQTHSVMKNVKLVLEDAGANWNDLVDVTVFLTNMKEDFPVFNRIYKDYFPNDPPCRTTIGVSSLPTPIAIELKCVAYTGD